MNLGTNTLVDMAKYDAHIFELKKRLRGFPKRLEEARRQLAAEELLLKEVEGPWSELEESVFEKEATIQVALDTIVKFEEHIKRVTTQKEYMAAKKQVEEARKLNEQLQNEILENRVKQEELAPRLAELRERYGRVSSAYEETETGILGERGRLEKEIAADEAALKSLFEPLEASIGSYHQKLLAGGKSPGIVPVVEGTCCGCNMAIPPQSYNLLLAQLDKLHTCAHCARIIFHQAAEPAVEEEAEQVASDEGELVAAAEAEPAMQEEASPTEAQSGS